MPAGRGYALPEKLNPSTPRSDARDKPFDKLRALNLSKGSGLILSGAFYPDLKNRGLAPSNVSIRFLYSHFRRFGAHLNPDPPANGEDGKPHEHGRDGTGEQDEGRPLRDEQ